MLISAPPILLALTVHECSHAYTAYKLGDPTAKMLGRVTLNPLKHLDPIGTLMLFFSGLFGWAKPVPFNPRYFKNISRDIMLTALAGPASNLALAAFSAVVFKLINILGPNFADMVPYSIYKPVYTMVIMSVYINVSLAIFNMFPIPPLDGSKVLTYFLPPKTAYAYSRLEPYGFMILVAVIAFRILDPVYAPLHNYLSNILLGGF